MSDEAVLAANDSFYLAFNQRDFEAMTMLWAKSVQVTCIHPGWSIRTGWDEVMATWRGILRNPAQARIVSGGASVQIFGTIANVICRELVGHTPMLATNIFLREDGDWRLMHHHSSPVVEVQV